MIISRKHPTEEGSNSKLYSTFTDNQYHFSKATCSFSLPQMFTMCSLLIQCHACQSKNLFKIEHTFHIIKQTLKQSIPKGAQGVSSVFQLSLLNCHITLSHTVNTHRSRKTFSKLLRQCNLSKTTNPMASSTLILSKRQITMQESI